MPVQDKSWYAFFKHTVGHAWNYHPKKMIGGLSTVCFSLNFAILHAYEENIAPLIESYMKDMNMDFHSEYLLASVLFLVGGGLIANSLRQSRPHTEVKKEISFFSKSDSPPELKANIQDEEQPLLSPINQEKPTKRFGFC